MGNLVFTLVFDNRGFLNDGLRALFGALDHVAFFLFSRVMGLMFDIARLTADKGEAIAAFIEPLQGRIYVILSIYMLFKVTISLLTYIVNPDSMTDKSQGAGKLVQRIIVSLVMLIFFPTAFRTLNEIQSHIIGNNTIPKIVLGVEGGVDSAEGIGTEIAYEVYNGTFIYDSESGEKVSASPETVEQIIEDINVESESNPGKYKYSYIPFVGFAVGILLTVLTLSMCIDVAVRVFKLIILQLVAPIPIISYMDPKQSKDGAFSKWIKLTLSVWAEVFIRLFVIYFILLVIEQLISNGGPLISDTNIFVKLALIIGLLFFAKDAPKFICDAIGIKPPEKGLFGGLGSIMAAGAIAGGAIGAGFAGVSAANMAAAANGKKANFLKNVGAGLFGAAGGVATGIGAATSAKDHNARAVMEAMSKRNEAALAAGSAGSTGLGRAKSLASRLLTGQTSAMRMDREIAKMEAQKTALSNVKSRMSGEMVKQSWTKGKAGKFDDNHNWNGLRNAYGGAVTGDINYKDFMSRKNAAMAAGKESFRIETSAGSQLINMKDAEDWGGMILKNNEDYYIQHAINETDAHYDKQTAELAAIAGETGATVTNRSSINDRIDSLNIQITRAKAANETNKQNDRFAGKK